MHEINSAIFLESINNRLIINQFFPGDLPVFSLILTETLAKYPLIQLSFSYCLFPEIYKNKIFKNLPFAKTSTREI